MESLLVIGKNETVQTCLQNMHSCSHYDIVTSDHFLSREIRKLIEENSFSVVLYEVTAPRDINKFLAIHHASTTVPKIVIIPDFLRPLKVWQNSRDVYYDVLNFPGHLKRLSHSIESACRLYNANKKAAKLKEQILENLDELSIIIEAGRTIASSLQMNDVVNSIMDMCTNLIKAEAWSLLLLNEKSNDLVFKAARGSQGEKVKEFRLTMGQGIAGWVARERKPLIVNDVRNDHRFFKEVDYRTKFETKSILCAPLIFKDKLLAVIEIINKLDNQPFEQNDLNTISILLDSASIALENAKLFNQAEELAVTDDLTGLYNARYLDQLLETEISRCQRFNERASFLFLDLDFFKTVNDRYGHMVGRAVLKETADLMKEHFRETDYISRYGGDEFVIVLPHTDTDETFELSESLRKKVEGHTFLKAAGYTIRLTASFGIATYPVHAQSKEDLILMADKAMFQAKGNCRNRVYITSQGGTCEYRE